MAGCMWNKCKNWSTKSSSSNSVLRHCT